MVIVAQLGVYTKHQRIVQFKWAIVRYVNYILIKLFKKIKDSIPPPHFHTPTQSHAVSRSMPGTFKNWVSLFPDLRN